METKHTSGPWTSDRFNVVGPDNRAVASIDSLPQREANARLIAAAPDAYALLSLFREWYEHAGERGPSGSALLGESDKTVRDLLEAYFVKATGGAA